MKPSPSTLCPTPSAARAGVPNRDVNRVSHMYTPESSTPASDSGAPTRSMAGTASQAGAANRISPRRSAIPMPIRNPPPRTITEDEADRAHDRPRGERIQHGGAGRTCRRVGESLAVAPRGDRDQPHLHHLAQGQQNPDVEPGRGHRRERRRADQPPHPDAVDQVEAEMARHHRHRGRGEAQDDGSERPDGERAGGTREGGHGAAAGGGGGGGTSLRNRWNTALPGKRSASRSTYPRASRSSTGFPAGSRAASRTSAAASTQVPSTWARSPSCATCRR